MCHPASPTNRFAPKRQVSSVNSIPSACGIIFNHFAFGCTQCPDLLQQADEPTRQACRVYRFFFAGPGQGGKGYATPRLLMPGVPGRRSAGHRDDQTAAARPGLASSNLRPTTWAAAAWPPGSLAPSPTVPGRPAGLIVAESPVTRYHRPDRRGARGGGRGAARWHPGLSRAAAMTPRSEWADGRRHPGRGTADRPSRPRVRSGGRGAPGWHPAIVSGLDARTVQVLADGRRQPSR
jgi:hypothetical protein